MNVFVDTEFTDFRDSHLISLGMASEYGEDFYAEVPYPDHACSAFVREVVVPLLRTIPNSYFTKDNLHLEIIKWLEIVRRNKEDVRSEEHTSELQSLMRISYAVFCLKKKKNTIINVSET